jgi:fructokinase
MSKILSYGEILWDIFPDYKKPGGSPANLAYHLHALGNESRLVSRIGDDSLGNELIQFISDKGLPTDHVQVDTVTPTGTVGVEFNDGEPFYTIHQPAAWDEIEFNSNIRELASSADAICFASLSQRAEESSKTLNKILKSTKKGCLKVFDLNLREPFIDREAVLRNIELSDVIKFNEDELAVVAKWMNTDNLPAHILKVHPEKIILITLGAKGSAMVNSSGKIQQEASPISGEGDFVGVGDAFLACVTHLILQNEKHHVILKKANQYAAYVASQKGGMPEIPDQIINKLNS